MSVSGYFCCTIILINMFFAENDTNLRLQAYPKGKARCAICKGSVIAKCGELNIWHWAHERACSDNWRYEPITSWHLDWQNNFEAEKQEVVLERGGKIHRADVLTKNEIVIEFQNSLISLPDILKREQFYRRMIWVINAANFVHNLSFPDLEKMQPDVKWYKQEYFSAGSCEHFVEVPRENNEEILGTLQQADFQFVYGQLWRKSIDNRSEQLDRNVKKALNNHYIKCALKATASLEVSFPWKSLRRAWMSANKTVFLDLNNGYLLRVAEFNEYRGHRGVIGAKEQFLAHYQ